MNTPSGPRAPGSRGARASLDHRHRAPRWRPRGRRVRRRRAESRLAGPPS